MKWFLWKSCIAGMTVSSLAISRGTEYGINALGIAFSTGETQKAMQAFQEKRGVRLS